MGHNLKRYLNLLWQSIVFWSVALACFAIIRYFGLEDEDGITVIDDIAGTKGFLKPLASFSAMGGVLGILYASIDFLFDKLISKRLSLGLMLVTKTFIEFVFTIAVLTLTATIVSKVFTFVDFNVEPGWWLREKMVWGLLFYLLISSLVFSIIKIAVQRFGRGVFLKMLRGAYSNPKEEERIFMFLDLKDSTTIAERLGHHKYSQFIQDCFFDLNEVVLKYEAEIYQYVGDEAVLSWSYKRGLFNSNCIEVFFAFEVKRASRNAHYLEKYGVFPEFKAGMHGGILMAAEVGFIRKELAYHGDVINTSARIQAECNKHNVNFLLSEKLLNDLGVKKSFSSKPIGDVLLKGKQKEIKIYSIAHYDQQIV
ncbi:adenylate/guanylate cyclase domain-containing protein [Flagellimonas sp. CMM7]|nr:adenylate/guanylate cyclase domain-containing protein [Flagellimonas sp. CMM7]UII80988.1 adenylate/guanylate cyclase domain-containing protein [Flagellimonas sp. CMM7]